MTTDKGCCPKINLLQLRGWEGRLKVQILLKLVQISIITLAFRMKVNLSKATRHRVCVCVVVVLICDFINQQRFIASVLPVFFLHIFKMKAVSNVSSYGQHFFTEFLYTLITVIFLSSSFTELLKFHKDLLRAADQS